MTNKKGRRFKKSPSFVVLTIFVIFLKILYTVAFPILPFIISIYFFAYGIVDPVANAVFVDLTLLYFLCMPYYYFNVKHNPVKFIPKSYKMPLAQLKKQKFEDFRLFTYLLFIAIFSGFLLNFLLLYVKTGLDSSAFVKFDALLLIFTLVIAPIYEELVYRQIIPQLYPKMWESKYYMILPTFLFCLSHGNFKQSISIIPISMLLCFIMRKTNNIFLTIFVHSVYNLFIIGANVLLYVLKF